MKKILSIILCLTLICGSLAFAVAAEVERIEYTKYPVILVPGYTSSEMYRIDEETGEQIHVWGDAFGQVGDAALPVVHELLAEAIKSIATQDPEYIAKRLGEGFNDIFEGMRCNPDGTSYYELYRYIDDPAEANYKYLKENYPEGRFQTEKEMMGEFGSLIGDENTYAFYTDFRMGAVDNANNLKSFIEKVIAYHNEQNPDDQIDKVNLFAVSHGGQVAGTYLTLYGYEGKVNNAVLTVPALGGAGVAYDAFNADFDLDEVGLFMFLEHGFRLEEELNLLVQAEYLGFVDDLGNALIPYVMPTIGYWGSLWDFIPVEYYEEIKDKWLDEEESALLIEKSDFMHYEIMSPEGEHYFAKGFKKAQDAGVNIYIMAGYDTKIFSGLAESSDSLITTKSSTGATCAPYGQRFSDGYTQLVDTGFYQVSPSMTVDASTAYLPEHTWFIENYFHGMTYFDDYTFSLLTKLLLTDESYDVHSFEEYPQFHATTNIAHTVHAAFDSSTEGYVSSADTALTVRNLSEEHNVTVMAITVNGIDIDFSFVPFTLAPGESKTVAFKGDIPAVSRKNFEVNVTYLMDTVTPVGERVFDFTVMNGDPVEYDESNPYTQADFDQRIDGVIDDDTNEVLQQYGVKKIVSMVYNMIYKLVDFIVNIINTFAN